MWLCLPPYCNDPLHPFCLGPHIQLHQLPMMNSVKGMQEDTHDTNMNENLGAYINYYVFETLKQILGALNVWWEPPRHICPILYK
jgi:hypothetical protein